VINGVADHIHLVIKTNSTVSIAQLVKKAKGVSSRFVNTCFMPDYHFKWSPGYGGFTISRWDLPKIINNVKKQKSHHGEGSLIDDLETGSQLI
jgi:REP element-mobilizing transposase RayT